MIYIIMPLLEWNDTLDETLRRLKYLKSPFQLLLSKSSESVSININRNLRAIEPNLKDDDLILFMDDDIWINEHFEELIDEMKEGKFDYITPKFLNKKRGKGCPFPTATMACMLAKPKVFREVGFMDERFQKCQYNDTDYLIRIVKNGGFKKRYLDKVSVIHARDNFGTGERKGPPPEWQQLNYLMCVKKHGTKFMGYLLDDYL